MIEVLASNAGSYLATLGIALVCSYLGLFTVLRRIVFTGVALAQLAALGVAGAFFAAGLLPPSARELVVHHGGTAASLGASVLGALALDSRSARQRISPDARVGLVYASAGALAILLVWRSPGDLAELQNILAGEVLLARTGELVSLWIGLGLVAAVHLRYRKEFLLVSYDPEFAQSLGLPERRLQLLFLLSLAVAVALSLKAAGLLLVFAFLVLPPVAGLVLGATLNESTWISTASALGASILGWCLAIQVDLPVAPTVATCLLGLTALAWLGARSSAGARAVKGLLLLLAGLALLTLIPALTMGRSAEGRDAPIIEEHQAHEVHHPEQTAAQAVLPSLHDPDPATRSAAAQRLSELSDVCALGPLMQTYNAEEDEAVCAACLEAVRVLVAHPEAVGALEKILHAPDADVRVHGALTLLKVGNPKGIRPLLDALRDGTVPPFIRMEALEGLVPLSGSEFGLDPTAEETTDGLARWEQWWRETGSKLRWDAEAKSWRAD